MFSAPAVRVGVPSRRLGEVGSARAPPVGAVDPSTGAQDSPSRSAGATGTESTSRGVEGAPRNTTEASSESDSAASTAGPESPSPVPGTTPPLSPSGDSCGAAGSETTSARGSQPAPSRFPKFTQSVELSAEEKVLKDFVLRALEDPKMNPHQGSVNSESLRHLTKQSFPEEFAAVIGDTSDKRQGLWVSFLKKISGNDIIMEGKTNHTSQKLWYLHSAKQHDWEQNDCRFRKEKREANRRQLREIIKYLLMQPNHCCLVDSICIKCTSGELPEDTEAPKQIGIFNEKVCPGDFVRWAKQQRSIRCEKNEQGKWILYLVSRRENSLHESGQNPGVVPAVPAGVVPPSPTVIPAAAVALVATGMYPPPRGFPSPLPHIVPQLPLGPTAEPLRMGPSMALGSSCTPQGRTCTTGRAVFVTTPMFAAANLAAGSIYGASAMACRGQATALSPQILGGGPPGYFAPPPHMLPPHPSGPSWEALMMGHPMASSQGVTPVAVGYPPMGFPLGNPTAGWAEDGPMGYSFSVATPPPCIAGLSSVPMPPQDLHPPNSNAVAAVHTPWPALALAASSCTPPPVQLSGVPSPEECPGAAAAVNVPLLAPSAPSASFFGEGPSQETAPMEIKPTVAPTVMPQPMKRTVVKGARAPMDMVLHKIRGILNKIAPDKLPVLLDQLWGEIEGNCHEIPDLIPGVAGVVFEVTLGQPNYCNLYADMCVSLCKRFSPEASHSGEHQDPSSAPAENGGGRSEMLDRFRKILLEKCHCRFEEGMSHVPPNTSEMSEEERERATIEEQRFRQRTLANVQFMAELYKRDLLNEDVMHHAVQQMLKSKRSVILEALAAMLTIMGKKLDSNPTRSGDCNKYFEELKQLAETEDTETRTRFLLDNVVELRKRQWVRRVEVGEASPPAWPERRAPRRPVPRFASSSHPLARVVQSVVALTSPAGVAQAHPRREGEQELLALRDAAPYPPPSKRSDRSSLPFHRK